MSPAKIIIPNGEIIYVPEDGTFDAYNSEELSKFPKEDRNILENACIIGENDGFILDLPSGDPIRITTTSFSNIPPAHRRDAEIHVTEADGRFLKLPEGTQIMPITNEQYATERKGIEK